MSKASHDVSAEIWMKHEDLCDVKIGNEFDQ